MGGNGSREGELLDGRVDKITLRSTRVVTVDGKMLAVPNSTIIHSTVASYTNFPHLRLDIDVTVAVTENLDRARECCSLSFGTIQRSKAIRRPGWW